MRICIKKTQGSFDALLSIYLFFFFSLFFLQSEMRTMQTRIWKEREEAKKIKKKYVTNILFVGMTRGVFLTIHKIKSIDIHEKYTKEMSIV